MVFGTNCTNFPEMTETPVNIRPPTTAHLWAAVLQLANYQYRSRTKRRFSWYTPIETYSS